jgi:hypothetical protein
MNDKLDTPQTDKIWDDLCDSWCNWSVDFAHEKLLEKSRKLERERNMLKDALERILSYQGRFAEEDPESIAAEALQSLTPKP